jgi:molybdopterin molybdotransferase
MLLSVAAAEKIVLARVPPLPGEDCPLKNAHGRVLREPVVADRDLPPFDRAMLDGIALHHAVATGRREFAIEGIQAAGTIRRTLRDAAACWQISTGAPLPRDCDTIVPIEDLEVAGDVARLRDGARLPELAGHGVHRSGEDARAGAVLVPAGTRLGPHDIGIAAAVGRVTLRVALAPRVAVVATGDELVNVETRPAPHQIRRSNDHALRALLLAAGCTTVERFHLHDAEQEIAAELRRIIAEYDWVVLCGGVSKGRFDFLPAALERLRVERCFHGVAQRPGKPFWFGVTPRHTPVFALPGNPVAVLVCAHRYVLPALALASGGGAPPTERVALAAPVTGPTDLTLFVPARVTTDAAARRVAQPAPVHNSGDFAGLAGTDGFVELPPAPRWRREGAVVHWHAWR